MSLMIYGIPSCGSCKKALKWLDERGINYEFIDTKVTPPTGQQIKDWVHTLGAKPMRNTSGKAYRELGSARNSWTDEQWIEAFSANAMLLKRPLFVKDDTAVFVGFRAPVENLENLLAP